MGKYFNASSFILKQNFTAPVIKHTNSSNIVKVRRKYAVDSFSEFIHCVSKKRAPFLFLS